MSRDEAPGGAASLRRLRSVPAIAGVELRRFLRDRSNIFFVFIFPLALVFVLGSQFGGDGPSGRVAIAGADGELRAAVVERLEADDASSRMPTRTPCESRSPGDAPTSAC